MLLALDCSKGYNRMDHSWLRRCLRAAWAPQEIIVIVECLLVDMLVLVLGGVEFAALHLASGLTQGCPASCMFYIVGVHPLLSSLQRVPLVSGVSGFVDDWSMGCRGTLAPAAVSNLILSFEHASGQRINRETSAVIPTRQLSDAERALCLAVWGSGIRVSFRERVLGVYIGMHLAINDQYYDAANKFDMALSVFGRVKYPCLSRCACSW